MQQIYESQRRLDRLRDRKEATDEETFEQQSRELKDLVRKITGEIEQVPDERYRQILHERYIMCKRWDEIADSMKYDLRYLYRLHGLALLEISHYITS